MSEQTEFTVLIVDDALTALFLLNNFLSSVGYTVITAQNGSDAVQLAETNQPDIILLDIMMPNEDGFSVMAKLKANPTTTNIPVILVTSLDDIATKVKGFDLGAVDYIVKPFNFLEIRARTRVHLKCNLALKALVENQTLKLSQIKSAQQAMLTSPESLPEARFAAHYTSLHEAGGDFYDVMKITKDIIGYFVSDVSGHDIEVSFVTAAVKALLKQNCISIYSPSESMFIINKVLLDVLPDGRYLTAAYLTINRRTKEATLINMGHPPVVYQPVGGPPRLMDSISDVLGSFHDIILTASCHKVSAGDRFFLYTDGLIESHGGVGGVWAGKMNCLVDILPPLSVPLSEAVESISSQLLSAAGKAWHDDVLLIGVEV